MAAMLLALAACSSAQQEADRLAGRAELVREIVPAPPFSLTAYARLTRPGAPLVVYIEGDGFAWRSRAEPSPDPTPRRAIGLQLAALDPSVNVVYLARPCQFTRADPACKTEYWTGSRFAPEVVSSLNRAVEHYRARSASRRIHLVGYSGGAAVAAFIASQRNDVASLRTVAGNLDTDAFNAHHHVTPMPPGWNPASIAPALASLPQTHYVGARDGIVPPGLTGGFLRRMGHARCAAVIPVPQAGHEEGWVEFWPAHAAQFPACPTIP